MLAGIVANEHRWTTLQELGMAGIYLGHCSATRDRTNAAPGASLDGHRNDGHVEDEGSA
jgi:hypothetical protein